MSLPDEGRPAHEGWGVVLAAAAGVFFASLVVVTFPLLLEPWCGTARRWRRTA